MVQAYLVDGVGTVSPVAVDESVGVVVLWMRDGSAVEFECSGERAPDGLLIFRQLGKPPVPVRLHQVGRLPVHAALRAGRLPA